MHVALNGSGATAPAAGDVVKVYSGLTLVASHTLTAGDIAADTVALTTSDLGADGVYSLTATITDEAGNESDASNAVTVTVDQTDAAAPTLTLDAASDTGVDDVNNETTDDTPTVHVALNGSGATAPAAGDVVKVYSGLTLVASHTLTAGDIAADTVALTTSDLGGTGFTR